MLGVSSILKDSGSQATSDTTPIQGATATPSGSNIRPAATKSSDATNSQTAAPINYGKAILPWVTNELLFSTVLDMASGDGSAVDDLNAAGYEAYGIDQSAPNDANRRITNGDMATAPFENQYFDLVICANTLQTIEDHRVPQMLAEINRLSNSYVLLTMPSGETTATPNGKVRSPLWWTARIADFGWRMRLLREDPSTGQLVILAEKPDSLAAKVLPLLDGPANGSNGTNSTNGKTAFDGSTAAQNTNTPVTTNFGSTNSSNTSNNTNATNTTNNGTNSNAAAKAITCIDQAIGFLKADRADEAYQSLAGLADAMGKLPKLSPDVVNSLKRIVGHMERKELGVLLFRLERELKPMLTSPKN